MEKKTIIVSAALLLLLSFTPLLTAEDILKDTLLWYTDDILEGSGPRAGQAVRFTVPSHGYSCKLESLTIYVEQYQDNQTMKASVWTDNGGNLISSVGSLLFEREKIVTDPNLYTIDLSDENIVIPPGGSFFGGWTSDEDLMAYWDTTEPNDVTLQKFVGSPWLVSPPNIDAPVMAVISFVLPKLNNITPVSWIRGSRVSVVINANDAEFLQDGLSTIEDVFLYKDGAIIPKISSTGFIPTDSNSLTANFNLPVDAALGDWDVYVDSKIFGEMPLLSQTFTIFPSPDLNRDGEINTTDTGFFWNNWLPNDREPLNMALIAHDGFAKANKSSATFTDENLLLQYDDAELNGDGTELEGIGTLAGQAVRFTVPSTGNSCKLESLSIFVEEFGDNQMINAAIWVDDCNDLMASSVGNSLFEEEKNIGTAAWHTIDLSNENIIIQPGESFFGGWTSDDYLIGFWDETEPNDMTLQKYLDFPWQIPPYGMDAPIKVEISDVLPVLNKISPVACARGTEAVIVVYADEAVFSQDGLSTINGVWLSKDGIDIQAIDFVPLDSTPDDSNSLDSDSLAASFDIPADAALGQWDVHVDSTVLGLMQPLTAALTIYASPDLNRDGNVNIADFHFFSKYWQKKTVKIPVDVLIPAGEFELGIETGPGDPAKPKTIIDEFYMGNLEITNQQYCYFLNSAISDGDIKIESDVVYASLDEENEYPYFTCNPDLPESQIQYSDGFFAVAGGKSRDMTVDPVVAVSWYGAAAYCNWRSIREGKDICYDTSTETWVCDFTKNGYRLPTEAEWEYAARGGKHDPYLRFGWGDTISHDNANYFANTQYQYDTSDDNGYHPDYEDGNKMPYTAPAGSFAPNDYGLYDMSGNVWQWCNDWYSSSYSTEDYDNPTGPADATMGDFVVIRGGSWKNAASLCRTSNRNSDSRKSIGPYIGFRVCNRP